MNLCPAPSGRVCRSEAVRAATGVCRCFVTLGTTAMLELVGALTDPTETLNDLFVSGRWTSPLIRSFWPAEVGGGVSPNLHNQSGRTQQRGALHKRTKRRIKQRMKRKPVMMTAAGPAHFVPPSGFQKPAALFSLSCVFVFEKCFDSLLLFWCLWLHLELQNIYGKYLKHYQKWLTTLCLILYLLTMALLHLQLF